MRLSKLHLIALTAFLAVSPAIASAQASASTQENTQQAPVADVPPADTTDPSEFPQAVRLLGMLNAAFTNTQINEVTKNKLFSCMFFNSLQVLNRGVQNTLKDNPELSFDNDAHLFRVATAICGVTKEELAQVAPDAAQPQTPQDQAPGR